MGTVVLWTLVLWALVLWALVLWALECYGHCSVMGMFSTKFLYCTTTQIAHIHSLLARFNSWSSWSNMVGISEESVVALNCIWFDPHFKMVPQNAPFNPKMLPLPPSYIQLKLTLAAS